MDPLEPLFPSDTNGVSYASVCSFGIAMRRNDILLLCAQNLRYCGSDLLKSCVFSYLIPILHRLQLNHTATAVFETRQQFPPCQRRLAEARWRAPRKSSPYKIRQVSRRKIKTMSGARTHSPAKTRPTPQMEHRSNRPSPINPFQLNPPYQMAAQ